MRSTNNLMKGRWNHSDTCRSFTFNKDPNWSGLLANITADDKRLVTLTSKEAAACLQRNPGVLQILRKDGIKALSRK
jgi:hypothetical protein